MSVGRRDVDHRSRQASEGAALDARCPFDRAHGHGGRRGALRSLAELADLVAGLVIGGVGVPVDVDAGGVPVVTQSRPRTSSRSVDPSPMPRAADCRARGSQRMPGKLRATTSASRSSPWTLSSGSAAVTRSRKMIADELQIVCPCPLLVSANSQNSRLAEGPACHDENGHDQAQQSHLDVAASRKASGHSWVDAFLCGPRRGNPQPSSPSLQRRRWRPGAARSTPPRSGRGAQPTTVFFAITGACVPLQGESQGPSEPVPTRCGHRHVWIRFVEQAISRS